MPIKHAIFHFQLLIALLLRSQVAHKGLGIKGFTQGFEKIFCRPSLGKRGEEIPSSLSDRGNRRGALSMAFGERFVATRHQSWAEKLEEVLMFFSAFIVSFGL